MLLHSNRHGVKCTCTSTSSKLTNHSVLYLQDNLCQQPEEARQALQVVQCCGMLGNDGGTLSLDLQQQYNSTASRRFNTLQQQELH